MSDRVFVDSNIIVYLIDPTDQRKHAIARETVAELFKSQRAVLSTQVANEVFAVATRKFKVDPLLAKAIVLDLLNGHCAVVTPDTIGRAMDLVVLEQVSYWDALMLASAIGEGCSTLLTEDLTHGHVIQGVTVENPFC